MVELMVIADDLTGALDSGVKFAQLGAMTQIFPCTECSFDGIKKTTEVVIVNTESRHLSAKSAYERVYDLARQALDYGVIHFYKKTDSALRGHIGAELSALHDALRETVCFIPALPQENRFTEKGIHYINAASVLAAISMIKEGKVYDLETERFKGMPVWPGHTGFELLAYASPKGRQNMADSNIDASVNWYKEGEWLSVPTNAAEYHMGLNTEMMSTSMHIGTHMDALCHFSTGDDNHWYNGFSGDAHCTNFGPTRCDITSTPPMVMRGVLLDMAGYKGVASLPNNYIVTAEDCEGCAKWEGVELKPGDAVMVRLGDDWPNNACGDAGLGVSAARYLVEEGGAILVGDDMACIDGFNADGSTSIPNHPQPVHHYLLIQQGVHILEFVQLDELARDKVYEFCFICNVSKVRGATGMFVRPIAII